MHTYTLTRGIHYHKNATITDENINILCLFNDRLSRYSDKFEILLIINMSLVNFDCLLLLDLYEYITRYINDRILPKALRKLDP